MAVPDDRTSQLQIWLDQLQGGDQSARDRLIQHACDRLQSQAHRMLKGYPPLRRWVQTEDIFQNAMLRLLRALENVKPVTARHFLALAALQIRRELLDLSRHYYGPQGAGAHHASNAARGDAESAGQFIERAPDASADPQALARWGEFHERAGKLPDEEREIFDLLFYQGLSQGEAAGLLGISERTVKRRWQSARLQLHEALGGEFPGLS